MTSAEKAPLLPHSATGNGSQPRPHVLLGLALVAASAVCFSVMSTFVKLETYSMSPMEAVFWRSLTAGALNYGVILYSGQRVHLAAADRRVMLYRVTAGFCSIALEFYAISQMVLADASVIIFTSPVMTFFLGACLLRERIDPLSLLCALTSFAGLVCVVRPSFVFGSGHATAGTDGSFAAVSAALLGAIGQAFVYVLVRKLKHLGVSVILHYFMLFSTTVSLLYIAAFERRFVVPDSPALWCSVVGSGVFTFLGQMLLTKGFQLEKAGIASVMRYLDVVCVFVWDALFLRERINHWSVVGAAIICACAVVIALQKAKAHSLSDAASLHHVVDLVSAFVDSATPKRWTIERACELGSLRLLRRVAAREALAGDPTDRFLRASLAAKGLAKAVHGDNLEIARWICREYSPDVVPVNAISDAAGCGKLRVLRWFFERYPSVRPSDYIALKAVEGGHLDVLQWLLPRLETPNDADLTERLLSQAATSGHLAVVRWLHEQQYGLRASPLTAPTTPEHLSRRALAGAITNGHFEVAKFLVDQGYELEEWHHEQIQYGARRGSLAMVQWVHAQQLVRGPVGWIDVAAAAGHLHIVKWVHENIRDSVCSVDAMDNAARSGHLEIVRWLHGNRAEGCSTFAMDFAAELGHFEVVKWLHEHRSEGCTSLAMDAAAGAGHLEIVQWLHAHRSKGCSTAAMDRAAGSGHLEIVQWLYEHRSEGCTSAAMDEAAARGHVEVVRWLHVNRAEGCTTAAMDTAARRDHLHVVEWLHANRTEGCTVRAMDQAESLTMLEWLYDHRAARCSHTAAKVAAFHGNVAKLMFLREKGIAAVDGDTAVGAVMHCKFEVFQWLRANYPEHVDMEEIERTSTVCETRGAWDMVCQLGQDRVES